jgi:CRP-like cAMP-binding protein
LKLLRQWPGVSKVPALELNCGYGYFPAMTNNDILKQYCSRFVPFTNEELGLLDQYFEPKFFKRKSLILQEGKVCDFIAFIARGTVRHFHIKDGSEITCDISFENTFITDFSSFNQFIPTVYNFQALHDAELLLIKRERLAALYQTNPKYETLGRIMAERIAHRATEIAMSLASDKPEARYLNLLKQHPDLFQRVPQKYIANFLGMGPESLSRIRKRISSKKS